MQVLKGRWGEGPGALPRAGIAADLHTHAVPVRCALQSEHAEHRDGAAGHSIARTGHSIVLNAGLVNADADADAHASEKILNASQMRMRQ